MSAFSFCVSVDGKRGGWVNGLAQASLDFGWIWYVDSEREFVANE